VITFSGIDNCSGGLCDCDPPQPAASSFNGTWTLDRIGVGEYSGSGIYVKLGDTDGVISIYAGCPGYDAYPFSAGGDIHRGGTYENEHTCVIPCSNEGTGGTAYVHR